MPALSLSQKIADNEIYLGINPVAPFTSLSNQTSGLYLPLASNMENGLAIQSGCYFSPKHAVEIRLSCGQPNMMHLLFQVHGGYLYQFNPSEAEHKQGWYAGAFIKWYFMRNLVLEVNDHSLMPYLAAGYKFNLHPVYIDLRLNQTVYACSWSNRNQASAKCQPYFSPMKNLSPIVPMLSVNIGYRFNTSD